MEKILVKDIMIPIANYVTVKEEDSLYDVFKTLEEKHAASGHAHRDAIVLDDKGQFKGKVTMIDIFKNLEPSYKKLFKNYEGGTLTKEFVVNAMKDFNLWLEPIERLSKRGQRIKASDVMHVPESFEFISDEDSLEKALHDYVMGVHQPLVVKKGDEIIGFLRFGDLFEVVRKQILSCPAD